MVASTTTSAIAWRYFSGFVLARWLCAAGYAALGPNIADKVRDITILGSMTFNLPMAQDITPGMDRYSQ